jgi:hypothetical protein
LPTRRRSGTEVVDEDERFRGRGVVGRASGMTSRRRVGDDATVRGGRRIDALRGRRRRRLEVWTILQCRNRRGRLEAGIHFGTEQGRRIRSIENHVEFGSRDHRVDGVGSLMSEFPSYFVKVGPRCSVE